MKQVLFFLIAATLSSTSFANIVCSSLAQGNDMKASFAANLKSANLFQGSTLLAKLKCVPTNKTGPVYPDGIYTITVCTQPGLADAGYNIVLSTGGFAGITQAKVAETTFAGPKYVGTLICK